MNSRVGQVLLCGFTYRHKEVSVWQVFIFSFHKIWRPLCWQYDCLFAFQHSFKNRFRCIQMFRWNCEICLHLRSHSTDIDAEVNFTSSRRGTIRRLIQQDKTLLSSVCSQQRLDFVSYHPVHSISKNVDGVKRHRAVEHVTKPPFAFMTSWLFGA